MKMKPLALMVAAACALATGPAFAITDEEGNAALQFSFVPPGARSLGMAGAFIGLADDATAAYTNPAGLTQLAATEISAEFRGARYSTEFLDSDTPTYGTAGSRKNGLGFVSVVIPYDRWAFAFYRHEFLHYGTDFVGALNSVALRTYATTLDVKGVNYGVSAAMKLSDNFSLGLGLAHSQFDLDSVTARSTFAATQTADDSDLVFNVGMLWKPSDRMSLGLVYRDGGNFTYTANSFANNASGTLVVRNGFPKNDVQFDVPRSFGAGLNFKVTDSFGVALDVSRLLYSDLTRNVRSSIQPDGPIADLEVKPLQVQDGTEIRLGAEYVFAQMQNPIVVRAGIWRDPEHTIRFRGTPASGNAAADANFRLFSHGDDEIHYTLGFGIAFNKFQIDAAADFSDRYDVYSMSGVYHF